MKVSSPQNLSVYQLVLGMQTPPLPLTLDPATLLSLIRSQIDLLISQQIAATLWVKLPPGRIWHSEITRYQCGVHPLGGVYSCYLGENDHNRNQDIKTTPSSQIRLYIPAKSKLRREYFFIVRSPEFCSLIVAYRPHKAFKKSTSQEVNTAKEQPSLLTINTFDGKIIQGVLDSIQQGIAPQLTDNFTCPPEPKATLITQLLAKQMQRQQEIERSIMQKQVSRVQSLNQQLHHNLELKDEYVTNVCQELRTPLTHMKTTLSLLNSPQMKPPQRQRYLQMLNTQCDRQNSLITGVLELVESEHNPGGTTLEAVHLVDIVPGVVSTYQPLAQEKGIMLAYTVSNELPPVWCVSGGLRQIMIHLLSNSIKFTPNGGQVWVWAKLQGNYIQLEFRDTGIGIAEGEIPKIFNRFYRVRPVTNSEEVAGAGLGLTIIQNLLWRCGGSISVKSKPLEGSTFTVNLPVAAE
ncbi:MAG: DICT sensory domain-containing protein [Nostocaceae cyanobacterium]|nr:DICT sensory domain-containing protein [Nostocaceae cyanobacterium]